MIYGDIVRPRRQVQCVLFTAKSRSLVPAKWRRLLLDKTGSVGPTSSWSRSLFVSATCSLSVHERERFSGVIQQLSAVQAVVPVTVLHCWENKRCSIEGWLRTVLVSGPTTFRQCFASLRVEWLLVELVLV